MSKVFDYISGYAEGDVARLEASLEHTAGYLGLEIEEFQKFRDEISAAIGTARFMDPPDGGNVSLPEQVRRMRAALDAAESSRPLAGESVGEAWQRLRSTLHSYNCGFTHQDTARQERERDMATLDAALATRAEKAPTVAGHPVNYSPVSSDEIAAPAGCEAEISGKEWKPVNRANQSLGQETKP